MMTVNIICSRRRAGYSESYTSGSVRGERNLPPKGGKALYPYSIMVD